jgi:DNA-binding response OmpR family regulator
MSKIKILYVEDEAFLGRIVKESLESRGFEVAMEANGQNAFPAFSTLRPDVCILDVMLPDKDGFELAEQIRAVDEKIPILFVTAKTRTEDVVRGFTAGANDYIRKPFSMEELIVRIHNVLRNKDGRPAEAASPGEPVAIGKYRFLARRQELTLDKEEKKLSFRESQLLKYLYDNRDKVIDRREILQLLWGNDSFFNSRNLDVYITKLRSYLKEDGSVGIITIKGIGYRFVTD